MTELASPTAGKPSPQCEPLAAAGSSSCGCRERLQALERENASLRRHNAQLVQQAAPRGSPPASGCRARHATRSLLDADGFEQRLAYEWTRAEHFWTPLSLLVIGLRSTEDELADDSEMADATTAAALWLESACRAVDLPCCLDDGELAVILPATNRTGAEAELRRLAALWTTTRPAGPAGAERTAELALGMAVAFDEAGSPLELRMLADASMVQACRMRADRDPETVRCPARPTLIDAA